MLSGCWSPSPVFCLSLISRSPKTKSSFYVCMYPHICECVLVSGCVWFVLATFVVACLLIYCGRIYILVVVSLMCIRVCVCSFRPCWQHSGFYMNYYLHTAGSNNHRDHSHIQVHTHIHSQCWQPFTFTLHTLWRCRLHHSYGMLLFLRSSSLCSHQT